MCHARAPKEGGEEIHGEPIRATGTQGGQEGGENDAEQDGRIAVHTGLGPKEDGGYPSPGRSARSEGVVNSIGGGEALVKRAGEGLGNAHGDEGILLLLLDGGGAKVGAGVPLGVEEAG